PEGGLYYSMLLRRSAQPERDLRLTPAAALAALRAVERLSPLRCEIKWPNDLLCGGKKLCGILTEGFSARGLDWLVLGIGVNVNTPRFPPELEAIAVSIRQLTGRETALPALAEALTEELDAAVAALRRGETPLEAYRARCATLGRPVRLLRSGGEREAFALDVDADFTLRVRLPDGSEERVFSGEVSIRESRDPESGEV
ncbi:MAG: biotin--[acetyl-CoA-carboxylase] ligase, partial [Oscillospiraceae bacterium]|nr:biotin--[acetyl-CoA-carboxylase] ligase [Oscillospiraceae bacterium]